MGVSALHADVIEVICEFASPPLALVRLAAVNRRWRAAAAATVRFILRRCRAATSSPLPAVLCCGPAAAVVGHQCAFAQWFAGAPSSPASSAPRSAPTSPTTEALLLHLAAWAAGGSVRALVLQPTRPTRAAVDGIARHLGAELEHVTVQLISGAQVGTEILGLGDLTMAIGKHCSRVGHFIVSRSAAGGSAFGSAAARRSRWTNTNTITRMLATAVPPNTLRTVVLRDRHCGIPNANALSELVQAQRRSLQQLSFLGGTLVGFVTGLAALTQLVTLDIPQAFTPEGDLSFAEELRPLVRLTHLNVAGAEVAPPFALPWTVEGSGNDRPPLRRLDISGCGLKTRALATTVVAPFRGTLEVLSIAGDDAVAGLRFAALGQLAVLRALYLPHWGSRLDDAAFAAMFEAEDAFPRLSVLDITACAAADIPQPLAPYFVNRRVACWVADGHQAGAMIPFWCGVDGADDDGQAVLTVHMTTARPTVRGRGGGAAMDPRLLQISVGTRPPPLEDFALRDAYDYPCWHPAQV